mmetsp:Transcript_69142/g.164892  ORF Transcript_69142/g.164892 Transcript_69142/m.164892 type:complete len:287 (+) Transcript_69142:188-1048(+)
MALSAATICVTSRRPALCDATNARPSSAVLFSWNSSTDLMPAMAWGSNDAIRTAIASAAAYVAAASSWTAVTSEREYASDAEMVAAVSARCRVAPAPMMGGSLWRPPRSATIPSSASLRENFASLEQTRMSAALISSTPAPMHQPEMAATTGFGDFATAVKPPCHSAMSLRSSWRGPSIGIPANPLAASLRSRPYEKCLFAVPARSTTHRTRLSAWMESIASLIAEKNAGGIVIELRKMVATPLSPTSTDTSPPPALPLIPRCWSLPGPERQFDWGTAALDNSRCS